jgi:hypothetical protein
MSEFRIVSSHTPRSTIRVRALTIWSSGPRVLEFKEGWCSFSAGPVRDQLKSRRATSYSTYFHLTLKCQDFQLLVQG